MVGGRHVGHVWAGPRFGPLVTPVPERDDHRRAVHDDADDTVFVRVAEAIYTDLPDIVEADQLRFVVSANTRDFRPGAVYAGFRFGTAHDLLLAMGAHRR